MVSTLSARIVDNSPISSDREREPMRRPKEEREREGQTDRQTETERQREKQTDSLADRDR